MIKNPALMEKIIITKFRFFGHEQRMEDKEFPKESNI